ncbi:MAG: AMP-binding protein [Chitinophagales bacterium]
MNVKDFNILYLNGNKLELFSSNFNLKNNTLDKNVVLFINQWINSKNYVIVETSGSTGKPKSIKILKQYMLESAKMTCQYFSLQEKDNVLLCMSAKHIGGMMMIVRAIYAKMNLIVVSPSANPLKDIDTPIDFLAMVPYQVNKTLEQNTEKLQKVKKLIIGGGTINYSLEQKIIKHQISAFHTFGMTETISHIAIRNIQKGKIFHCLQGISVAKNKDNSLVINAPTIGQAHLETNDIIELIDAHSFIWKGRKDFAIESGGVKMHPEMIEQKLASFISNRFLVSSLPDDNFNNKLILIIEGKKVNLPKQIFNALDKYEQPKEVFFIDKFVETESGKINRFKTTELIK